MTETLDLLTVKEAARRLKVSRSTVRTYADLLEPPPLKLCTGERVFTVEQVAEMRRTRREKHR